MYKPNMGESIENEGMAFATPGLKRRLKNLWNLSKRPAAGFI